MEKYKQIELFKAYLQGCQEQFNKNLDKIPENWDGFELRHYLLHIVEDQIAYKPLTKERLKDFKNHVLVENM